MIYDVFQAIMNNIGDSHYVSKADETALLKIVFNVMLVTIAYATHQVRSV